MSLSRMQWLPAAGAQFPAGSMGWARWGLDGTVPLLSKEQGDCRQQGSQILALGLLFS